MTIKIEVKNSGRLCRVKNNGGLFVSPFECMNGKEADFFSIKGETFEEQIWILIYEGFNPIFSDDKIGAIASLKEEGTEVIGLLSETSDWRRVTKLFSYHSSYRYRE